MKKTLSASALKHEAFVLALLTGMTAADAARKAGYGRKNINVRIIAWELLQREDIQARLKELSEAATDEAIMTLRELKIRLSEIARASYDSPDRNGDPIAAMDMLCRLEGAYKTKPREVNVAPIARVIVDQARIRAKLLAKIEAVVKRPGSGAVESGDIDSLVEDGC
ncbi:terminase small subunit [Chloroflexota bacterium]